MIKKNKLVSIIIPVYNVASYIKKSLSSALSQDYDNIEYIIIDDCGTDQSMELVYNLVKEQHKEDKVKIIHHSTNKGLSAARNSGINSANGEYVYFMDSDDIISSDCISKLYGIAKMYNAECIEGNTKVIGGSSNLFKSHQNLVYRSPNLIYNFFSGNIHPSAWNKLLSRQFLIKNKLLFDEGLVYEDLLFVLNVCKHANCIALSESITYEYIIRPNSITTTISKHSIIKQYNSILYNINKIYNFADSQYNTINYNIILKYNDKYCFKAMCRLSSINTDDELKLYYYNELSKISSRYSIKTIYSLFMRMPYNIFKIIFTCPYLVYKKIKSNVNF